nr:hypothetical protein [Enterococcus sp. HY326]
MDKHTGLLTKIRLIKEEPLLVRFTLDTGEESINCIVSREILAKLVLMLPDDKYNVTVRGHMNTRSQLVIRWLAVDNVDKFTRELGL